jgi:membrane protease YdiL (CAAX protease family)
VKPTAQTALTLAAVALISAAFALVGMPDFYDRYLGVFTEGGTYGFLAPSLYQFAAAFFLFLVIPWLVVTRMFRERPADYGWRPGGLKDNLLTFAWAIPLVFVLAWLSSSQPEFQAQYPLFISRLPSFPLQGQNVTVFVLYEFTYLFYYIGYEFFFRGFALVGLKPSLGKWGALLFQAAVSTILHYHKPLPEMISAFPGGIAFGLVALRSRSLLPVIIAHWFLGFFLDLLILLRFS